MYVFVCTSVCLHVKVKRHVAGVGPPFYHTDPRDGLQAFSSCFFLYLLSHLVDLRNTFCHPFITERTAFPQTRLVPSIIPTRRGDKLASTCTCIVGPLAADANRRRDGFKKQIFTVGRSEQSHCACGFFLLQVGGTWGQETKKEYRIL